MIRVAFIVGIIVAVLGLMAAMVMAEIAERKSCELRGGKIVSKTGTSVGITSGGNVAIGPSTIKFCVTPDGRILG